MVVVVKTTTSLKNERVCSVSKEGDGGGGEDTPTPLKTSAYARFRGRGMVVVMKTTTCLENECIRSVSKEGDGGGCYWWVLDGGGGYGKTPPSKTSVCARFRGWLMEVAATSRQERKTKK